MKASSAFRHRLAAGLAVTLTAAALVLGASTPAQAQTAATGQIVGKVADPSGAVIPGATATVKGAATGLLRTASTNAVGVYTVPLLPPGTYSVTVTANGFKTVTNNNVVVPAATSTTVDMKLPVGASQQSVTVEAGAAVLQTQNVANGGTVNQTTITSLPLTNRNYTQILQLNPGVASQLPNAAGLGRNTVDVNVNGARVSNNSYEMDGQDVSNLQIQGTAGIVAEGGISIPSPDAIEQFRVQTGQYDAVYGRGSGANVDVITKSGTNQFHGDLFEFVRNNVLNANDFFINSIPTGNGQPAARPELKQNQFGGTFGGPILKDKLFFFGSYQGTYQVNGEGSSSLRSSNLPLLTNNRSAAALGATFGGLSGLFGGAAVAPDGSNISPVALALLNYKLPNGTYLIPNPQTVLNAAKPASGGFSTYSIPSTFSENQIMVNLDWTPNAKNRVTEKFFWSRDPENVAFTTGDLPGSPAASLFENGNLSLAYTYIISPTVINELSGGIHRIFGQVQSQYPVTNAQLGMPAVCNNPVSPIISVTGVFSMGGTFNDGQWSNTKAYSVKDQMSWLHGAHNIRLGAQVETTDLPFADPEITRGQLSFQSFPDFLLGMSAAQNGSAYSNVYRSDGLCGITEKRFRVNDYSTYIQDDYTMTPRLTLNLGLRWDIYGQSSDANGHLVNFWPQLATNKFPASGQLYTGWIVPQNYGGVMAPGVARNSNKTFAGNGAAMANLGPRIGLSWQPGFSNKVVLRGGYGIYYGRTSINDAYQFVTAPPLFNRQTNSGVLNAAATFQSPWAPGPPPFSAYPVWIPRTPTSALSLQTISPVWQPPMMQQWSANLQYELTHNTRLQIGYVGNHGGRIEVTRNINQAGLAVNPASAAAATFTGPTLQNTLARVPILGINSISQAAEIGISNYNGLQTSLTQRMSHGLQFQLAYTYSKALTDVTGVGTFPSTGGISGDPHNPMNSYGPADFNTPQRLVANFVWEIPFQGHGVAAQVLGGWGLSGVLTVQTGRPFSFSNSTSGNIYGGGGRAQMCPGFTYNDIFTPGPITSKLGNYFNPNAISCKSPQIGNGNDWGDSGRGIGEGPGQHNLDMSVLRNFRVPGPTEGSRLQVRAELYNATNTPQFNSPSTNVSSSSFGQITSTSVAPRLIQLGFKYIF